MFRVTLPNGAVVEAMDDASLATLVPVLSVAPQQEAAAPVQEAPSAPKRVSKPKASGGSKKSARRRQSPKASASKVDGKALLAEVRSLVASKDFEAALALCPASWGQEVAAIERAAERHEAKVERVEAAKPKRRRKSSKRSQEAKPAQEAKPQATDEDVERWKAAQQAIRERKAEAQASAPQEPTGPLPLDARVHDAVTDGHDVADLQAVLRRADEVRRTRRASRAQEALEIAERCQEATVRLDVDAENVVGDDEVRERLVTLAGNWATVQEAMLRIVETATAADLA